MLPALLALLTLDAWAVRAKDVGEFLGARDNHLTGVGLVVGLNRTGDSMQNEASIKALAARIQGLGLLLSTDEIRARNVAMVMVNAELGPDSRSGARFDVTVASTGDAMSLDGGYLLMSPLLGPDGRVYATAQGALVVGGFSRSQDGTSEKKNVPTVGWVPGGAILEREVGTSIDWNAATEAEFILARPDFTTVAALAEGIDQAFGVEVAEATSSSTVKLVIPEEYRGHFPAFAAKVEGVDVKLDAPARIVISERTGTLVMGGNVTIQPVAIAHGGLSVEVRRTTAVAQPNALAGGKTTTTQNSKVTATEASGQILLVEGATINDLIGALNQIGARPRDMVVILRTLEAAGALNAELVVQ